MIELEAQEIVDNEYIYCDNCGELTHEDEMRHAYCHNGYESWGEPIYSECETCADAEMDRLNREYGRGGRRAYALWSQNQKVSSGKLLWIYQLNRKENMENQEEQYEREMARIKSEEEWAEIFAIFNHLLDQ